MKITPSIVLKFSLRSWVNPRQGRFVIFLACLFLALVVKSEAGPVAVPVKIQVEPDVMMGRISPDFIGLGYETSAVAQTNYFSADNATLIQLYRNLSPHGLIRIGGNISDHTRYVPDGISAVHTEREVTIINRTNLADLGGFARATGWRVMWGLNLGTGSQAAAVQEATAIAAALGDHLQSFQIGNEVDLLRRFHFQNGGGFALYYSNYLDYKAAIQSALPGANFSGPDVAGNLDWLKAFAQAEGTKVKLLTHHYYRTGARTPGATIENLLKPDDGWQKKLQQLQAISRDSGVPFRINEVNSFYGGGKAGVSDTFASALWCLDYMFELAACGCNGVNLETDINQLGWISHYSPIVHDATGQCRVRPEYYGMLAFALAGKGDLLKLKLNKGEINLSAYATKDEHGAIWITVVNKDISQAADLEIVLPAGQADVSAFWLKAPTVESQGQVTLAGTEVSADGKWSPGPPATVPVNEGSARLQMSSASAVLLQLK
jgi:hypothetical protein